MSQRNISGKNLDKAITSDDILGKDVIDASGNFIGVAERVFIDPTILDFVGISIDKGFLKKDLAIGRDCIDHIATHAVFLNITVAYEMRGMLVFDKGGKKVGQIGDIVLSNDGNKIESIILSSALGGKKMTISANYIETIGYNVILKVNKDDIKEG